MLRQNDIIIIILSDDLFFSSGFLQKSCIIESQQGHQFQMNTMKINNND